MPPKKGKGKSRKYSSKKTSNDKKMEDVAQTVYNKMVEPKEAVTEQQNKTPSPAILTGDVLNAVIPDQRPNGAISNYYYLLPAIAQSVTGQAGRKYNTRIGNEITLKSIHLKGILNYTQTFADNLLPQNKKIMVRFMVLSQKRAGSFTTSLTNISNRLLTNAIGTPFENTAPYSGVALDAIRGINRDVFTVHYEKDVYLEAPVIAKGTNTVTPDVGLVPSSIKFIDKKFYYGGKSGQKLTFANASAQVPENFAPFICIGYSSMSDPINAPSAGLVNFTYNATAQFSDA